MNDDKGRTDSTDPNSRSTTAPYKWWRSVFSWFDKFILIPLAGILISSVILVRLTEFWTGPPAYKIYVIGNLVGGQVAVVVNYRHSFRKIMVKRLCSFRLQKKILV